MVARKRGKTPQKAGLRLNRMNGTAAMTSMMFKAQVAGANILKEAQDTFWGGYAGYFQDPDQHLWEVVWNPHLIPDE